MSLAKLVPNDPRVSNRTAVLNGRTYSYMLSEPSTAPKATIFLIHGWPDIGFGWRNQIPLLTSLGLRVVVPDMMGYGGSDSPDSLSYYTFKQAADDMAELARQFDVQHIMLGGHDWGGMVVYRIALWYPQLVTSIFSICTPYVAPSKVYRPLEELTKTVLPNFKYQLQLAGPNVEAGIVRKEQIKSFLRGMFGGRTPDGRGIFSVSEGVSLENLDKVGPSQMINDQELEFYAEKYARNGMRGPLNWYRTRELNFKDEIPLAEKAAQIECPAMFIGATRDDALPPAMSKGMGKGFEKGVKMKEVASHHWCLWAAAEECNALIKEFVDEQLQMRPRKSIL